jgi:hypothetical protein
LRDDARSPGDRSIKRYSATWHAGPHFVDDECEFMNFETVDTNRDVHALPLPADYCYQL